jgi:hypothetical protein
VAVSFTLFARAQTGPWLPKMTERVTDGAERSILFFMAVRLSGQVCFSMREETETNEACHVTGRA